MDDAYYLIATVPKNAREELRIAMSEYRGHQFVDVRVFADVGGEDRKPTRTGVTVSPARLRELIEALVGAEREAVRRGLLS